MNEKDIAESAAIESQPGNADTRQMDAAKPDAESVNVAIEFMGEYSDVFEELAR